MTILTTIARILLGLIFGVLGLNGFLFFIHGPAPPHTALQFYTLLIATHYSYVVFGVQVIGGWMLLLNRFVPFALVMLAAVIVNILTFHVTMWPNALVPMPLLVTVLWFIVAWSYRARLLALLK